MKPALCMAVTLMMMLMAAGCQAPPPPRPGMSVLILPGATEADALQAAHDVLLEYNFRIETRDDQHGYLRSLPVEETVAGGTGRISDPLVRAPNQIRRVAEAYVEQNEEGATIRLAVVRERQDTTTRRAFMREREDVDFPSDTPIDQEAGTSPEQYESWTRIGRDRQLENSICRSLEERLAPARQ